MLELFDFVAGCDSGWGGKPAPGQLLAFVAQCGLTPARVAMVGDSKHDLDAGRAAGMAAVAVLTGMAGQAEPVSYTHLEVYKRQALRCHQADSGVAAVGAAAQI